MSTRSKWTAIPGLLALAIGAVLLSAYSGASSAEGRGPAQPIDFPHPVHVQQLGLNCLYCHNAANKSPDAGMPAMSTCAGCHNAAAVTPKLRKIGDRDTTTSESLTKLFEYMDVTGGGANMKPVPWVRIHKVPDYVQFPHMRHVNAGVTCQSCHGKIQEMDRVYQAASLNMGWCVNCHVQGYDAAEGRKLTPASDSSAALVPPMAAPHGVAAGATPRNTPSFTAERKTARYDCAVCHY
ncbi:MAG: cytochrome c3 family protein [Gemmatimonadaceae bacterium]|nr:cytochrome c3 family protein [Gemmatimonadaceae bacterium]